MLICMEAVIRFVLTPFVSPKLTSTCLLSPEHAEQDQMLGSGSNIMAFPYCNVTQEQDVGLEGVPEVPRRQDCFSSFSRSDGAILSFNGIVTEQEIPRRDLSTRSPNVESPIGFKSPSSLLAWLSKMPTPQQDVYMSAIWSDSRNFKSVNNVSATSVTCRSLTFVSPGTIAAPPSVNPYHHYKPNYNSGRHLQ